MVVLAMIIVRIIIEGLKQEVNYMGIGDVIREYRKRKNMTQEQMANYLGVTAPAVNKWENGNSLPDITLLAPIARLLDISLDTLLSFHETLSNEEINKIITELDFKLREETYDEAFHYAKLNIKKYPNCHQLIWQSALILDTHRLAKDILNTDNYEEYIHTCYVRALESENEDIRTSTADSLYGFHIRKEEYEKAEEYLNYFSNQNPLRKEKQAFIYSKTNRLDEAYQVYEQLLFSGYQTMSMVLNSLYKLAQQEKDTRKARILIEKQSQLANVLDMGGYQEVAPILDYATSQQDVEMTIETMEKLLANLDSLSDFSKSSLYRHLDFKKINKEFIEQQRNNLKELFSDEETFGYMKNNERWKYLTNA